ncbi:MAG TPA: hypothetical protein VNS88_09890 [Nitrospiraceae bacterium]|nr:hypothetical protein [Nitrospiraceae bacterium]
MTIDTHPLWADLLPLVRVSTYDRDGGHGHPRHRMDVRRPAHHALRDQLLAMEVECATCGRLMRPVRPRKDGSTFLNVACELAHRYGCARSARAHREYERIVALVLGWTPTPEPGELFQ